MAHWTLSDSDRGDPFRCGTARDCARSPRVDLAPVHSRMDSWTRSGCSRMLDSVLIAHLLRLLFRCPPLLLERWWSFQQMKTPDRRHAAGSSHLLTLPLGLSDVRLHVGG